MIAHSDLVLGLGRNDFEKFSYEFSSRINTESAGKPAEKAKEMPGWQDASDGAVGYNEKK